jgi:two-component SAPR family response regulator
MLQFSFVKLYWMQSQNEKAIQKAIGALQLLKENEYDSWIVVSFPWIIPLLLEITAKGIMKDYLQNVFKKVGYLAKKELIKQKQNNNVEIRKAASMLLTAIPTRPSPGLRVFCLGEFKLFRGETEILENEWRYKKSKILFKYLLSTRNRGFQPKEVLMELLWPEEEAEKASNRLHVVITSLRKALEPKLERGIASSYILTRKNSYKLDIGMNGWTDIDEFKSEMELAEKYKNDQSVAIQHYLKAESVYKGEFMEEDLYEEWCMEERDRLREKYLDLLTKIISFFKNKKEYKKCITYSNKYLNYDKYAEEIYQSLMICYAHLNNTNMVMNTYEKCKKNIVDDLCCPLMKETEKLYTELIAR